jgi:hypothetical protein
MSSRQVKRIHDKPLADTLVLEEVAPKVAGSNLWNYSSAALIGAINQNASISFKCGILSCYKIIHVARISFEKKFDCKWYELSVGRELSYVGHFAAYINTETW